MANAVVFTLNDRATPRITIRVGHPNKINTVTFDVSGSNPGDGTPIQGSEWVLIRLEIRATAANPLTGILSVNSAIPLNNGAGTTIPTSKISWISGAGTIPSGTYAGISNQTLASFTSSVRAEDRHTFFYANDTVYDSGTYTGQVTYTWFVP